MHLSCKRLYLSEYFFFPSCKPQLKRKQMQFVQLRRFTSCLYKAQIASDTEFLWLRSPIHCIYFHLQCMRWFSRKYIGETHLQWNPFNYRTFVPWDLISDVLPADSHNWLQILYLRLPRTSSHLNAVFYEVINLSLSSTNICFPHNVM